MRSLPVIPALLICAAATLAGCATPEPDPNVAQADIPDASRQKCSTSTGSRIPQTCSSLVKSTSNAAAVKEMQRHAPMDSGK